MSDLYRGVPPTSDGRPWRMVWMDGSGEIVDALPMEPVGTLTVEDVVLGGVALGGWGEIQGHYGNHGFLTTLPPGKYDIVLREADDG